MKALIVLVSLLLLTACGHERRKDASLPEVVPVVCTADEVMVSVGWGQECQPRVIKHCVPASAWEGCK